MKQLLQNHPNFYGFPVKSWQVVSNMLKEKEPLLSPLSLLFYTVMLVASLAMVVLSLFLLLTFVKKPATDGAIYFYACWCITLILLLIDSLLIYYVVTTPKREQLRYYEKADLKPLSLEQRQALQLVTVSDYSDGFWTETLEYYPLKKRVKDDDHLYRTLSPVEAEQYQAQVYSDWNIKTKSGYTDILNQLWEGMHSQRFLSVMNDDQEMAERVANLAELIKEPEQYVMNCVKSLDNRPPALLWGFDLWRALVLSRNSFSADIISEEQAWQDILQTASYVHGIFGSLDDFITNYRLGNAFWSNSSSMACSKLAEQKFYQEKCDWPIKSLAWPDADKGKLPPCILNCSS